MSGLKRVVTFTMNDVVDNPPNSLADQSLADSMIAIETRYTKTSMEYDDIIREIKEKCHDEKEELEIRYHDELEELREELHIKNVKISELNGRLEESRNSREDMLENIKKARKMYERRIGDLENCVLEANLRYKRVAEQNHDGHNQKVEDLQHELDDLRQQNSEVSSLLDAERSDSERKREKIVELDKMLAKITQCLQDVENKNLELVSNSKEAFNAAKQIGVEKGAAEVLQSLLEDSQKALDNCRAELCDKKHDVEKLETELASVNKEFSNAKVDVRFLTRENKLLQERLSSLNNKMVALSKKFEKIVIENTEKDQTINNFRIQVQTAEESAKATTFNHNLSQKVLEENKLELQRLRNELTSAYAEIMKQKHLEEKIKNLQPELEEMKIALQEKTSSIVDKERKMETQNTSITMLREACVVLENQLDKFERVVAQKIHEMEKFQNTTTVLEAENISLKNDVKKARADLNEIKSLKIRSDKKLMDIEVCLKSEEQEKSREFTSLLNNLSDLQAKNKDLTHELAIMSANYHQNEGTIAQMTKVADNAMAENAALKLEMSKTISELVTLKDKCVHLKTALEEAIKKAEQHKLRWESVTKERNKLVTTNTEYSLKLEATINQQMKLIEHLTSQNELLSKKKKFKFFGGEKISTPMTTPLRESNTPSTLPTPRRLIIEHKAVKNLEEMSTNLKNELAILKTRQEIITHKNSSLPPQRKENCVLLKSKTSTLEPPRMSHNIPHRFTEKLAMKTNKCWICQEPIYFGRFYSVCNACPAVLHIACAIISQNTCGLPKDVILEIENQNSSDNKSDYTLEDEFDDNNPEGWVQLASEKLEQHYIRLEKGKMRFYTDETCIRESRAGFALNSRTRVELRVDLKSVNVSSLRTLNENRVPFLMKIVSPKDVNIRHWNDEDAIYLLMENAREKRFWTRAIMKFSPNNISDYFDDTKSELEDTRDNDEIIICKKRIFKENGQERLDVNCVQHIEKDLYLLGCEDGLFSRRNDTHKNSDDTVKIEGVGAVFQIEFCNKLNSAFMIEGAERRFVSTPLGLVRACAQAAACSKPMLTLQSISGIKFCHLFCFQKTDSNNVCVAIATQKHISILMWKNDAFVIRQSVPTRESVTCMLPTRDSLIFGCDKLYELDLKTFELNDFIDESDSTMYYLLFSCREFASFPMAILDVSSTNLSASEKYSEEYLVCFPDMATFVDSYGQRTRVEDIVWSKLPLAVVFRHPNLYVFHFSSLEIIPLSHDSYTRGIMKGTDLSNLNQLTIIPETKTIPLISPRMLGNGDQCRSIILGCIEKSKTEIFEISTGNPMDQ